MFNNITLLLSLIHYTGTLCSHWQAGLTCQQGFGSVHLYLILQGYRCHPQEDAWGRPRRAAWGMEQVRQPLLILSEWSLMWYLVGFMGTPRLTLRSTSRKLLISSLRMLSRLLCLLLLKLLEYSSSSYMSNTVSAFIISNYSCNWSYASYDIVCLNKYIIFPYYAIRCACYWEFENHLEYALPPTRQVTVGW